MPQLAKHAGVSERTVWYDIKAGRLRVRRLRNGRVVIPRAALRSYRGGARDKLLTIQDLVVLTRRSDRTIRREIQSGQLPAVSVSPRRLLISEKDARRLFKWSFEEPDRIAEADRAYRAERLEREARDRERDREREHFEHASAQAKRLGLPFRPNQFPQVVFNAKEVAQLSGKTVRQVYHDIAKGALAVHWRPRRKIEVHWLELIQYLLP